MNRNVSHILIILIIYSLTTACTGKKKEELSHTNFILIVADDLGYNELGCYGQKIIKTPNIDRLASEGMRFTQFYAGSPVCAPSRCVLLTGMHSGHAYIRDNREHYPEGQLPIPDSILTVAEILKEKGYKTAAIGKWGLGYPGSAGAPNNQGFDLFYGYNCQRHAHNHYPRYLWRNGETVMLEGNDRQLSGEHYAQDMFTLEALQFIRENKDQPFFLYLALTIPHVSIQVPEEALQQYRDRIPEEPYKPYGHYEVHPFPRAGYAAMVSYMDNDIGKLMKLLEDYCLDKNTLVLFTSDNGPTYDRIGGSDSEFFNSTGNLRGLKGSLYEGGIRVPLIAWWPEKIEMNSSTEVISAFQDIMPTFAEIAGYGEIDNIDGKSLFPLLTNNRKYKPHEYLYFEFAGYGGQQALRYEEWKTIRTGLNKDQKPVLELYNLDEDPGEQKDLAGQYPEIVRTFSKIMAEERFPSEEFPIPALDRSIK